MIEVVIALLMIVDHEIKEHRIQPSMSECLKGKRVAERQLKGGDEPAVRANGTALRRSRRAIRLGCADEDLIAACPLCSVCAHGLVRGMEYIVYARIRVYICM